jgi:hypothetical protein
MKFLSATIRKNGELISVEDNLDIFRQLCKDTGQQVTKQGFFHEHPLHCEWEFETDVYSATIDVE